MESNEKYEIIKRLAQGHISKSYASIKLGYTLRHVNRLLKKYQLEGKSAFVHGNTARKPIHAFSEQKVLDILPFIITSTGIPISHIAVNFWKNMIPSKYPLPLYVPFSIKSLFYPPELPETQKSK